MKSNIIVTSNGIRGTNFPIDFIEEYIKNKSVIVIDNGTYGTGNYNVRQDNVNKFYEYGAKEVNLITIDNDNTNLILTYDICYVMGGSIANLLTLVQTTNIKRVLEEFLKKGIYIGESAGSIILDEDTMWYFNLKRGTKPKYDITFNSYKGLGFINKHIYPHYNKESTEGTKKILEYNEEIDTLDDGEYLLFVKYYLGDNK